MGQVQEKETSQINSTDLIALARDKSREGRQRLIMTISDLYNGSTDVITKADRLMMTEIIVRLIKGVEVTVRQALAEHISMNKNVPCELVKALVDDEIGVAYPILANSPVLQDPDLIEIVRLRTMEFQLAITMRSTLSTSVSAALAESRHEEVVNNLLLNAGADISPETFEKLVERCSEDALFGEALAYRDDLPKELTKKVYWAVSAALRQHLIDKAHIDANEVDDVLEEVVPVAVEKAAHPQEAKDWREFVLSADRSRWGEILAGLLRRGMVKPFLECCAGIFQIRFDLVEKIAFEEGGETLGTLFKAIGMEMTDFITIFVMLRQGRLGDQLVDDNEISLAIGFFETVDSHNATKFLKHLQRNPDYLNALRLLGQIQGN